jgi:hypothetical protein
MCLLAGIAVAWSPAVVRTVRSVKHFLGWFSGTAVLGIPLDWPARFIGLGLLHALARRRLGPRGSAALCLALLVGSEILEIFASRVPGRYFWPDLGDLADVLSGMAGVLAAEWLARRCCGSVKE